jgi:hypothetical protein
MLTLVLTGADHWTTYLCLRAPVQGWSIVEGNPAVNWLFEQTGLVGGLVIDSAVTVAALAFLLATRSFGSQTKIFYLAAIVATTSYAVVNNFMAVAALGISPLGVLG